MKRKFILLLLSPLVIIINSVLSYQSWSNLVRNQNVQTTTQEEDSDSGLIMQAEEYRMDNLTLSNDTTIMENEKQIKSDQFQRVGKALIQTSNSIDQRNVLSTRPKTVKSANETTKTGESLLKKQKRSDSDEEFSNESGIEYVGRHKLKHKKKKFKWKKKKKKPKKKYKMRKKYKKFMMPLLLAYKLKFFTLIPIVIAGLVLLVKTAGMAGFFFAMFSAVMALKGKIIE